MAVLGEIGKGTTPRFVLKTVCKTSDIVALELTIKSGAETITKTLSAMLPADDDHQLHVDLTQAETLLLSDEVTYQYHYKLTNGFANSSRIYRRAVRELLSGRGSAL